MKPTATFLAVSLTWGGAPACASALTEIERITVTSDFRDQDIQRLASSVSVIPELVLQNRQAQHLEETLNVAANVNVASGASRGRFVQIRGIGERSQFAEPMNPSVGFVVDDFDFSGSAGLATLFDVDQVEVLRGPQATEFGAGALAGVVKIKTTEAGESQPTRLAATMGSERTWSLGAATGDKLADGLFYRVAVQQYHSDGFIHNSFLKRDDTDNLDEFTGRLKLKYAPNERVTLDVNYQYFNIDNGYDAFSLDNDGITRSDEPGFDRQQTHALGFKAEHAMDWGKLVALVSHSTSDLDYGYDEDWTFEGFHPNAYRSTDHYFRQRDISSFEFRALSSRPLKHFGVDTRWVVGAYGKVTDEQLLREYTFNADDFTSLYKPQNYALYLNTDTLLSAHFNLRVGLRLDKYDIHYSDSEGFAGEQGESMLGGKVVLDYHLDDTTVYGLVSRGYKAGGANPDQRITAENRFFSPEFVWNYELGVKGRFKQADAFVRMAVFYMDRDDTQVSDFDVQLREDGTPDFIDIIGNADTGTNWGLEMEGSWQVSQALLFSASLGYLDATFSRYQRADGSVVEKQTQAQAPKYTFNLAADLALSDALSWHLAADGKDEFRFSDGHNELSPSYVLFNTSLNYQMEVWRFSLWAKNLFDKTYFVRGFGGFSNDPRDGEFGFAHPEPYFQLGDGRQVGVSARYEF